MIKKKVEFWYRWKNINREMFSENDCSLHPLVFEIRLEKADKFGRIIHAI